MRVTRRSLDVQGGLIWVQASIAGSDRQLTHTRFILDTGTPNTILSLELAEGLGYPESAGAGVATYDTPDGPVQGYTARIRGVKVLGLELNDYLVGVKIFQSWLHVPGILGLDFFSRTDLHLSFRSQSIQLAW